MLWCSLNFHQTANHFASHFMLIRRGCHRSALCKVIQSWLSAVTYPARFEMGRVWVPRRLLDGYLLYELISLSTHRLVSVSVCLCIIGSRWWGWIWEAWICELQASSMACIIQTTARNNLRAVIYWLLNALWWWGHARDISFCFYFIRWLRGAVCLRTTHKAIN